MKDRILFLLALLIFSAVPGQNRTNIWYFGREAGIDFNSGTAVPDTNSVIDQWEGSSVICDTSGQLLMYTNGIAVYDANHDTMPSLTGPFSSNKLDGHQSSTQSALIVPQPGNDSIYYIFTTPHSAHQTGFRYSIVNLNLNGGMGDVITLNVPLVTPVPEKVTAVHHANQKDIWVVTRIWDTDEFYAYLLTDSGLSAPVVSHIGVVQNLMPSAGINGQLKASPHGNKLAQGIYSSPGLVELFDFDDSTGMISNLVSISPPTNTPVYGLEFSPDGRILYVLYQYSSEIYQYDLLAGSPSAIVGSGQLVATTQSNMSHAMQLAPDGKIYIVNTSQFLSVIANPNVWGSGCNYSDNSFSLDGKWGNLGLPNIVQSYVKGPSKPLSIVDRPRIEDAAKLYPNPVHDHAMLSFENDLHEPVTIDLFDVQGKMVMHQEGITGNELQISRGRLKSGVYSYRITKSGKLFDSGRFMLD